MHRIVEDYLRIYCNYRQSDWDSHLASAEFTYSLSIFHAIGLNLFFMDLGWNSKTSMELFNPTDGTNVQSVTEHRQDLTDVFQDVQYNYAAVREQQRIYLTSNHAALTYAVRDKVMMSASWFKDHYRRNRPSAKLNSKRIRPFE